jgi:hypothetical protein
VEHALGEVYGVYAAVFFRRLRETCRYIAAAWQ